MGSELALLVVLLLVTSVLAPPPPPGRPVDDSDPGLSTNKISQSSDDKATTTASPPVGNVAGLMSWLNFLNTSQASLDAQDNSTKSPFRAASLPVTAQATANPNLTGASKTTSGSTTVATTTVATTTVASTTSTTTTTPTTTTTTSTTTTAVTSTTTATTTTTVTSSKTTTSTTPVTTVSTTIKLTSSAPSQSSSTTVPRNATVPKAAPVYTASQPLPSQTYPTLGNNQWPPAIPGQQPYPPQIAGQQFASNYQPGMRGNAPWPAPPVLPQYPAPGLPISNGPPMPMYPNQYARYPQVSPLVDSQQLYLMQRAQQQQPMMSQPVAQLPYGASRSIGPVGSVPNPGDIFSNPNKLPVVTLTPNNGCINNNNVVGTCIHFRSCGATGRLPIGLCQENSSMVCCAFPN